MFDVTQGEYFEFGGERFYVDMSPVDRRRSDAYAFTLVKHKAYLKAYEALASTVKPKSILELGIFQGGSYVLLDKLFKPSRMSAVDISGAPIAPLMEYIRKTPGRHAHFGVSQSDRSVLNDIFKDDLNGVLDLVVDDASHSYEETKRSFEILFPLLSPGGTYIIEDWAWAHSRVYQGPNAPFANRPALSTLLFEQIALMGSTADINDIRIFKSMYIIRKSPFGRMRHENVWDGMLTRGKDIVPI